MRPGVVPQPRSLGRWDADAAAAALAAVGTAVALAPSVPEWLRAVLVVPFLLALPGYAALRLAGAARLGIEDRALLTVGLSISVVAIAGLVLDRLPSGLSRGSWLAALDLWVAVTLVVARRRRAPARLRLSIARTRVRWGPVAALALAGALTAAALAVDIRGAQAQERRERFVELWLVPSGNHSAVVGVRSAEPGVTGYRVTLSDGAGQVQAWSGIRLDWGAGWQTTVTLPAGVHPGDELAARLYRASSPGLVRSVHVAAPA
jgi:hypothetical protein